MPSPAILCNGQLSSSNSFNIALYPYVVKYSVPALFFEPTVHISFCINCIDYGIGLGIEGTEQGLKNLEGLEYEHRTRLWKI